MDADANRQTSQRIAPMTPTAERIVIAAFVAVVLAAVVLTGAQTFQAEQPRTPPP